MAGVTLKGETKELKYSRRATLHEFSSGKVAVSISLTCNLLRKGSWGDPTLFKMMFVAQWLPRTLPGRERSTGQGVFLEPNQGIDSRAPEPQPQLLPPAAPLLLEYSLQTLSLPQDLHMAPPMGSDPDFLFPDLVLGPHSTPGTHEQINECFCDNRWKSALPSYLPPLLHAFI